MGLEDDDYKTLMEELKEGFGTNDFEKLSIIFEHYILKDKPKDIKATIDTKLTEI